MSTTTDTTGGTDTKDDTHVRETLVYLGQRQSSPHSVDPGDRAKTVHVYAVVDTSCKPALLMGEERSYLKALGWGAPGNMHSFEFKNSGGTVLLNTRQDEGVWHDAAQRAQWQITHDTIMRLSESLRVTAQKGDRRLDLALLEPFRNAYAAMSGPARVQLIARITSYVAGMTESRMRLARKNIERDADKKKSVKVPKKRAGGKKRG